MEESSVNTRADKLYKNANCLSPMVRAGTLPLRLLSLRYGATSVYGEEIIDKRIIETKRIENSRLNTIDYICHTNPDTIVFRTNNEEKNKNIFQIGTSDAVYALKAAEHISKDIASIDINMGCPKHFSIQGGMGAALLNKPEIATDIIKTLRRNLNMPISCKIRLLDNPLKTIDFAKSMEYAGVSAMGVHCRKVDERPCDRANWEPLIPVVDSLNIPVLANGDLFEYNDIIQVKKITNCSSVLVARGALTNASIFCPEGFVSTYEITTNYLKLAIDTENNFQNTKYTISRMLPSKFINNKPHFPMSWVPWMPLDPLEKQIIIPQIAEIKNYDELLKLWNLNDCYNLFKQKYNHPFNDTYTNDLLINDNNEKNIEFYCNLCNVQMLSKIDFDLHTIGKKHCKKKRSLLIDYKINNMNRIYN